MGGTAGTLPIITCALCWDGISSHEVKSSGNLLGEEDAFYVWEGVTELAVSVPVE